MWQRSSLRSGPRPHRPGCFGVRCRFRRDRARGAVAAAHFVRALRIPHPKQLPLTPKFCIRIFRFAETTFPPVLI
ncbi:MAG: hypothetical protein RMJ53_08670 [Chitinophagales bacterium]|nr:hypothetical protein [Chitinophagales bacterium]